MHILQKSMVFLLKKRWKHKLADKIHHGVEGVQYLDHKVLAQILEETEPDILRNAARLPG